MVKVTYSVKDVHGDVVVIESGETDPETAAKEIRQVLDTLFPKATSTSGG